MPGKPTLTDYSIYTLLAVYSIACLFPLLLVAAISVTDERSITMNGYSLFPEKLSLAAYKMLFTSAGSIAQSYFVSVSMTLIGTVLAVLITYGAAFSLANPAVKYRNLLAFVFFIPMLFSAGLVPWYMINAALGLKDNYLALIIPRLLFSPFNLFLVRNYMRTLPSALAESARIDGAGDLRIAFRIYFPLCMPVLATIALFYGLGYWNDWYNAVMLVNDTSLYPLQYLLFRLQSQIQMAQDLQELGISSDLPTESFKMATVLITIGPVVLLYPYLQKYFIKGLVIGSVKG